MPDSEQHYIEEVLEICRNNLDDYSIFEGWKLDITDAADDYTYIEIVMPDNLVNVNDLRIRANSKIIEVDRHEDSWEELHNGNFWQILLWSVDYEKK